MAKRRKLLLFVAALALLALAALSLFRGSNLDVVVPGRVYRSGQLSPEELERAIAGHGIRAILNLRGEEDDRDWYRREIAVAERRGVVHRSVDLVPEKLPPRPAVLALIEHLKFLPEPILIHCAAGVDRTGFASVIARMRDGSSLAEAREELSFRRGHIPFGPAAEIGRTFDRYEDYLGSSPAPDSFATFESWVRDVYVPYVYSARLEPLALPSVVLPRERMDVRLRITNTSPGPWVFEAAPERGIKLGVRLRVSPSDSFLDYDRHAPPEGTLAPGEELELEVAIWAPPEPGEYELKLDMVDEHVTWFEDQGSPPLLRSLSVRDPEPPSGKGEQARQLAPKALALAR
jgi:protein tyrosine/serine phosphatase